MTRLAPLSRWLALAALLLGIMSVIGVRFGGVPPLNGLAVLGAAMVTAALAAVCAAGAMLAIWRYGGPGLAIALKGGLLALVLLLPAALFGGLALRYPVLNDVTTDIADPPSFGRSRAAVDGRRGLIPRAYDAASAQDQQEAYPELRSLLLDQSPEETMALALRAATNLGWQVLDSAPPVGRTGTGRIEAVARSLVFGIPDDITIRIRPALNETRLDMRSASRVGRHDFGANARRIRQFQAEIETLTAQR